MSKAQFAFLQILWGVKSMQSEESQECQRKCAVKFLARSAYCEAAFSPEGKTPNASQFHACAIAAVSDEILY